MKHNIDLGRDALERLLKEIGDTPMSKLRDMDAVDYDNPKWYDRPKTRIVKWLMDQSGVGVDLLAEYLGCSKQYLNNKMTRDSFSLDDLIIAAYACGYEFTLTSNTEDKEKRESYAIHIDEYFKAVDDEVLVRISDIEKESKANIKAEYERKKAELERMKQAYGFDD
mgnify:CR=1 FL=1